MLAASAFGSILDARARVNQVSWLLRLTASAGLFAFTVLSAGAQPAPVLSEPLKEWARQIEEAGAAPVYLVPVYTDPARNEIYLGEDVQQRAVVGRYLRDETFVAHFLGMHALAVSHQGPEGSWHFILLNMARAVDWKGADQAMLAHELGHLWLRVQHFPVPAYTGAADACVNASAGDIVQHFVIRKELVRRGIDFLPYWLPNLRRALSALESGANPDAGPRPLCQAISQAVLWIDVQAGLAEADWSDRQRFLEALESGFPALRQHAEPLLEYLKSLDLEDRQQHLRGLLAAAARLQQLARELAASEPPPAA